MLIDCCFIESTARNVPSLVQVASNSPSTAATQRGRSTSAANSPKAQTRCVCCSTSCSTTNRRPPPRRIEPVSSSSCKNLTSCTYFTKLLRSFCSFLFTKNARLPVLAGEKSITTMVTTLYESLEAEYGVGVTRLYRVFKPQKGEERCVTVLFNTVNTQVYWNLY